MKKEITSVGSIIKDKYNFYWKFFEQPKRKLKHLFGYELLRRGNRYYIQKEANRMRNELVIDHLEIVKLLGWTDQYDDDYYWVILRYKDNKIVLSSCVSGFKRLKGKLSGFDYYQLEDWWKLNVDESNLDFRNIIIK